MSTFKMPSLGADMEAGRLVEWLKKPGEQVERGDIIAVVETQKGAIEVECFQPGILGRLLVDPGTTVPVGTPMAVIDDGKDEEPAPAAPAQAREPAMADAAQAPIAPPPAPSRAVASPAARRMAAERGVDLAALTGTGPGGAIISTDVEQAARAAPAPAPERKPGRVDPAAMRQAIAAAMARSKREIPHYYLSATMDASRAVAWLDAFNADRPAADRLLMTLVLGKAVALALKKHPMLNGHYGAEGFAPADHVHLGMAIALRGGGLTAPALHNADARSLPDLMAGFRDLVARARAGTLRSSEMSDATVTVSSLGERGVDALMPIITPPQVAIVGFGAVLRRPWVADDGATLEVRPVVTTSLAADHRVSDGHRGALFLRDLDALLQDPEALT
ncbi:Dihydrolipoamide acetyltransferase component (E2) of acetoin dehydrogenase complex [Caenispirillum salinarum AK4]|uniref:Dihydrolipoamide acetyltransferase component of pyruvate dehydrogenase complex n=1 Tax=Caenispirillum salinarum AK4 TaxID=1238182 RepID=K9H0P5_9PROT|nr:dihydrolipoamide acetyltransferase family protein [Caenispirillum salinarum]EKV31845.1 Dihydrolipoamide acetyltransferase component (E2) of acetoin dehydrogenase complex [Caenispirillum salinarum AK4]